MAVKRGVIVFMSNFSVELDKKGPVVMYLPVVYGITGVKNSEAMFVFY